MIIFFIKICQPLTILYTLICRIWNKFWLVCLLVCLASFGTCCAQLLCCAVQVQAEKAADWRISGQVSSPSLCGCCSLLNILLVYTCIESVIIRCLNLYYYGYPAHDFVVLSWCTQTHAQLFRYFLSKAEFFVLFGVSTVSRCSLC